MKKHTEQDIHDLLYNVKISVTAIDSQCRQKNAISAKEGLLSVRHILRKYAAKCDEIERKLIEDDE